MSRNQFRLFILLYVLITCLAMASDFVWPDPVAEQTWDYLISIEPAMTDHWHTAFWIALAVTTVMVVTSIVGLLFFQSWSRHLALASLLLTLCFYPFIGVSVNSAVYQLFYDLSSTVFGVILALVYYSPIAHYYQSPRKTADGTNDEVDEDQK